MEVLFLAHLFGLLQMVSYRFAICLYIALVTGVKDKQLTVV